MPAFDLVDRTGRHRLIGTETEKAGDPQFPVTGHFLVCHFAHEERFQPDDLLTGAPGRWQCCRERCELLRELPEQPGGEAGSDLADRDQQIVLVQPQEKCPKGQFPDPRPGV